jgi:hypothetical protein
MRILFFVLTLTVVSAVNDEKVTEKIGEEQPMTNTRSKQLAMVATLALLVSWTTNPRAQDTGNSMTQVPQAAAALTGDQQSAANSALCSAIGSHFPNPAAAGPSALSDPAVMSTAASMFAGSTHLPLAGATDMLKGYVGQHATDILASCATTHATSGLTSKLPGTGTMPSIPKMPY